MNLKNEVEIQQAYYAKTAKKYDEMHVASDERDEHFFAMIFMLASLDYFGIKSILDIGSGTGRVLDYIKRNRPDIYIVGIEPVEELRQIGYEKGISENSLIEGDAKKLQFLENEFDLVCEFGALHHIKNPEIAVSEMLRVAKKAIFISDSNNFGQGSYVYRCIKQIVNTLGLWGVANYIKTKGKGYIISEGDGLSYSYSIFNNYKQIQKSCKSIHLLNTKDGKADMYRTASHIALLGIKN